MDQEEVYKGLEELFTSSGFKEITRKGEWVFLSGVKTTSLKRLIHELGGKEVFASKKELSDIALKIFSNRLITNDLYWAAKRYSDEHYPAKSIGGMLVSSEEGTEAPTISQEVIEMFNRVVPAVNISSYSKDKIILLDPSNRFYPVSGVDSASYLALTGHTFEDLMRNPEVLKVIPKFNPFEVKAVFEGRLENSPVSVQYVNYYIAPSWRRVKAEPAFTGFIKKLMEHLFPNKEELEYVLDWMHYAIVNRNNTMLCLIGARGTGKGILIGDILGALIGYNYTEVVGQAIIEEKFNGAFKGKRLVFFDEVNISTDSAVAKIKAFCNAKIVVEEKGEDSETIDNYTSTAVASNSRREFRVEPQERRFSVPEVTEAPLTNSIDRSEIEDFVNVRVKDPESVEVAEFGQFLLNRTPKNSSHTPLKGKYFFNLCRLSISEWKAFIIEYFIHNGVIGESISNRELMKLFKSAHEKHSLFPSKRAIIEDFLLEYIHEGEFRIGKVMESWDVGKGRTTFAIMPDTDFLNRFGLKYKKDIKAEDCL